MEAEQVIEKILAESGAEAEKIKHQFREKEAAEQARLDEQLAEYKKQTATLSKKAADSKKLHLLAAARMQIAKDFLAEKRKVLDGIFNQARERLTNLPDDQYRQLITNLMLKAVETGDEEVIIDNNEKRIDQQLIEHVNERLRPGGKGNLKLSDIRQNIGAGFILKRGKIKNNVSLDVLLSQGRRELEIELAKELFVG
jgi:V/A-type H+-transporting ATPase subunit E